MKGKRQFPKVREQLVKKRGEKYMKNYMNDNMVMMVVGGEQTETLPGGGFHGGEQTETLPGGGFHGGEQTETLPGGGFHGGEI